MQRLDRRTDATGETQGSARWGVRISTNVAALNTHRVLLRNDQATGRSLERLSSGLRINRAADDAAGLAISEGLRSQLGGMFTSAGTVQAAYAGVAGRISYDGRTFDLAAVDYTGATTPSDYISRMTAAALSALGTTFVPVIASSSGLVFTGQTPGTGSTVADAQRVSWNYTATLDTGAAVRAIGGAIRRIGSTRANLGALENRLEHTAARLDVSVENTTAAFSRIRDADLAAEMTVLTRNQVLVQAGTAMLAQANRAPEGILRLLN
jgi:flagellin-like hook-associated protein FlgL